ncbi:hypothetical protein [Streptococcus pneumoniae]|uniref:hypothetical protein n=1 Tax=Streptococcus pneumoniae TaxID=1313 RepID=UPI002380F1AC|nr:hypothetical protein [Streptococcus pneumoniae]
MKIKEQTKKLAACCSKHSFEVVDETDEAVTLHTVSGLNRFSKSIKTKKADHLSLLYY